MQSSFRGRSTAAAAAIETLARASAGVVVMLLSVGKAGALRASARTCWHQSPRSAPSVDRAYSSSLQQDAVGARPIKEARPEESEAHVPSFYERLGSPRFIAAPMVEQSEAAFRYLVRRHGCDLAYTQMIHAKRFAPDNAGKFRAQRFDGVDDQEDRPLITQFCGNDPDTVVRAARHVEHRCDAIDLNLGCPQNIAKKGNYGAFLLPNPQLCEDIVSAMSRELSVPVTVKIRVQDNESDTLDLARRLEGAGAQLLTVHGRTLSSKKTTQGAANWDIIRKVKNVVSIPVVANGGVETGADAERLLQETGADAVMSSEGLLENPGLFDRNWTPMEELRGVEVAHRILSLAAEYMELVKRFPAPMVSIKGHLFKMLYRLLECHHDLRARLGHRECDAVEADVIVREMCQRYYFDPDARVPLEGAFDKSDFSLPFYNEDMGCGSSKPENDRDSSVMGTQGDAADEAASVIAGAGLTARVHLSLSCNGLANLDVGSKSDPFVVVSMKSGGDAAWSEIGRTEVVANNLSPTFVTLIPATFRFEEVQMLRFDVYDVEGSFMTSDASRLDVNRQAIQGSAECALATVMGAHGQTTTEPLHSPHLPNQKAWITVRAEQAKHSSDLVLFELGGTNCPRGHKSVFFRISRTAEAGPPIPCYKSEVAQVSGGTLRWRQSKVGLPVLSNGDPHRPLVVELFSYKKSGSHVLLGACELSVDTMLAKAGGQSGTFNLSTGTGAVVVHSCALAPQPSFFDFLAGGLEMQFTVAIDYTASNGDPNVADSLHYHDPSGRVLNQYARSISSVGKILEHYDADKRFPVLGFGGCPIPGAPAVHCFAVNGREHDAEVHGIEAILDVYRESLKWVQLSGPTLFAPVINQTAAVAASERTLDPENQKYHVLMIVTDGVINDMGNTMDALVAAADLPFSVIIVGVGQADFSNMEQLDGDDVRIANSQGKKASRDIVQFVPMRDFANKGFHALAKEVLAEIPQQVVEYMANNKINACKPRPRPPQPPPRQQYQARYGGGASSLPNAPQYGQ
eukprot:g9072.t3